MVTAVRAAPSQRRVRPDEHSPLLAREDEDENCVNDIPGDFGQSEVTVVVKPGMADKMHLFICSAGIGVSLMPVNQIFGSERNMLTYNAMLFCN